MRNKGLNSQSACDRRVESVGEEAEALFGTGGVGT